MTPINWDDPSTLPSFDTKVVFYTREDGCVTGHIEKLKNDTVGLATDGWISDREQMWWVALP
jgi:hypothetical protein